MSHETNLLTARLLADGYCVVPNACAVGLIHAIDLDFDDRFRSTPFCEGGFYGSRTKRFGALLRRSSHAPALVQHPLVLQIVETILHPCCDRIVLNLTQAVELHSGALAQVPHRDQDLWRRPRDGTDCQVNVIWPLSSFIIESCPQRILLPNDRAIEPQSRAAYERFGLNERQIELISRSTPKRHYYLQSARGNRLFELGLGPVALAFAGASDPDSQKMIDAVLAEHGARDFASAFLRRRDLAWAADLLSNFQLSLPVPQEGVLS